MSASTSESYPISSAGPGWLVSLGSHQRAWIWALVWLKSLWVLLPCPKQAEDTGPDEKPLKPYLFIYWVRNFWGPNICPTLCVFVHSTITFIRFLLSLSPAWGYRNETRNKAGRILAFKGVTSVCVCVCARVCVCACVCACTRMCLGNKGSGWQGSY